MDIYQESKIDLEKLDHKIFGNVAPLIAETWNQMMDELSKEWHKSIHQKVTIQVNIPMDYINRAQELISKSSLKNIDLTFDDIVSSAMFHRLNQLEKDI